jgi:hypothetical protein
MYKLLINVLLMVFNFLLFGQSHQQWVATYNGPQNLNDAASSVAVDNEGNVISAGYTDSYSVGDCLVIKYNSSGENQWVKTYDGSANDLDFLNAVTADDSGNIYVTGNITGSTSLWDIITIKYDTDGNQKWVNIYNGTSNSYDGGTVIATDDSGFIYVGGYADNTGTAQDFILFKYNSSGDELWHKIYNGTGSGNDVVLSMTNDDSSNIYITGRSVGIEQSDDYTTIKYNSSGEQQWVARYNDSVNNWGETPRSVTVDNFGNVYVSGWGADGVGLGDLLTIKYNSNGIQQWIKRYHGPSAGGEGAYSVQTDDLGNVYTAGSVNGPYWGQGESDADCVTIKYDPDGNELWVATYNGPATEQNSDWILAMKVTTIGDVYVTGWSEGVGTGLDIVTIAYDSAGDQQWLERYDGGIGSSDQPFAMALDLQGNIYVSGFAILDPSFTSDMATIKYSPEPVDVQHTNSGIPENFLLSQNYPNPFNPSTVISYQLPVSGNVMLKVFDILGNEVATLVNEEKSAGNYEVIFNAASLSSGTYFYRLSAGSFIEVKKMILIK